MTAALLFLPVLIILVLAHEAGHALVARWAGCRVEEFGIFFPPRIAKKKIGETVFSLNLVPLGGFVRITGEDADRSDDPRSFVRRPRHLRIAILLSGVAMNLVLAAVLFSLVAGLGTSVPSAHVPPGLPLSDPRVEIVEVADRPELAAVFSVGDAIRAVEGRAVTSAEEAADAIRGTGGTTLALTIVRDGREESVEVIFPTPHVAGEPIGLSLLDVATYRVPWWRAPMEGLWATGRTTAATTRGIASFFRDVLSRRDVSDGVAGPVGIAAIVGAVGRQGAVPLAELTAVLSVNLALINALPFPALDGGRILFLLFDLAGIRFFRGHPERLAHAVGFALLLVLITLITMSDIQRLFS